MHQGRRPLLRTLDAMLAAAARQGQPSPPAPAMRDIEALARVNKVRAPDAAAVRLVDRAIAGAAAVVAARDGRQRVAPPHDVHASVLLAGPRWLLPIAAGAIDLAPGLATAAIVRLGHLAARLLHPLLAVRLGRPRLARLGLWRNGCRLGRLAAPRRPPCGWRPEPARPSSWGHRPRGSWRAARPARSWSAPARAAWHPPQPCARLRPPRRGASFPRPCAWLRPHRRHAWLPPPCAWPRPRPRYVWLRPCAPPPPPRHGAWPRPPRAARLASSALRFASVASARRLASALRSASASSALRRASALSSASSSSARRRASDLAASALRSASAFSASRLSSAARRLPSSASAMRLISSARLLAAASSAACSAASPVRRASGAAAGAAPVAGAGEGAGLAVGAAAAMGWGAASTPGCGDMLRVAGSDCGSGGVADAPCSATAGPPGAAGRTSFLTISVL